MHIARLERLMEVLKRVDREALPFDMAYWADRDSSYNDCGTACCAAGWGALDSLLQEEGLHLVALDPRRQVVMKLFSQRDIWDARIKGFCTLQIAFDAHKGFNAVAHFFDLDRVWTEFLFNPACYTHSDITPSQVIIRIHRMMRALRN